MLELSPGAEIAGYRIERMAGRGGMGVVYLATQLALNRPVALKVIAPELAEDEGFRLRFQRESQTAASIRHPNVVSVHDAREAGGLLFITMDWIEGTDLSALIRREGPLEPARAARVINQVASALDAAHARGLVHRDVKPANVLIAADSRHDHAYLTDFGLTKYVGSAGGLTNTGQWVGTLDYVAPEQISGGDVDARTDVYALGCVLYQTLTGTPPYPRDADVAKMYAHLHDPAPAPSASGAPAEFDAVVARALSKRADDRYPSAGDLARAALAAAEGRQERGPEQSVATGEAAPPTLAVPGSSPSVTRALPRRTRGKDQPTGARGAGVRRQLFLPVAAATLLAIGVVTVFATRGDEDAARKRDDPQRPAPMEIREPPNRPGPAASDWPRGESAYTVVLRSSESRSEAAATAQDAAEFGTTGVLRSDDHPRLRPGYWVAFLGVFDERAEANQVSASVREAGYADAYIRFIDAR